MLTILAIVAAVALSVAFYKFGYSAAKKNILVHIFKEKMISPEQYKSLENEDI